MGASRDSDGVAPGRRVRTWSVSAAGSGRSCSRRAPRPTRSSTIRRRNAASSTPVAGDPTPPAPHALGSELKPPTAPAGPAESHEGDHEASPVGEGVHAGWRRGSGRWPPWRRSTMASGTRHDERVGGDEFTPRRRAALESGDRRDRGHRQVVSGASAGHSAHPPVLVVGPEERRARCQPLLARTHCSGLGHMSVPRVPPPFGHRTRDRSPVHKEYRNARFHHLPARHRADSPASPPEPSCPGRDPMSVGETLVLGVVGSFIGGFIGWAIFGKDFEEGALQASGRHRLGRGRGRSLLLVYRAAGRPSPRHALIIGRFEHAPLGGPLQRPAESRSGHRCVRSAAWRRTRRRAHATSAAMRALVHGVLASFDDDERDT